MFFTYIKCLKIHQLNTVKITKKDFKEKLEKDIKVILKEEKLKRSNVVVKDKNLSENGKQKMAEYKKIITK